MTSQIKKYERAAGLFVAMSLFVFIGSVGYVAWDKGWFETSVSLQTSFQSGDGLYPGMSVQMLGLKAGTVTDVDLQNDNSVRVTFDVKRRFHQKIKSDSVVRAVRTFVIGDKVLDISLGQIDGPVLSEGSRLQSEETLDLIGLLSGKKMSNMLTQIVSLSESLGGLLVALQDPARTQSIVDIFDQLGPLTKDLRILTREMNGVGRQLNQSQILGKTMNQLHSLSQDLGHITPQFATVFTQSPETAGKLVQMIEDMTVLTRTTTQLVPILSELAPEFPRVGRRAIEAMDEAVIVLKAMQKSWLLSGKVEEVRKEEQKQREPASANKP